MEEQNANSDEGDIVVGHHLRTLTVEEVEKLRYQVSRGLLPQFHQEKLEREAAKNWDKFYKRNETRFFKDRHWTTREFHDLVGDGGTKRNLLEDDLCSKLGEAMDIVSMIFVMSAIHPDKFVDTVHNINRCLRPGGMVLVRDYGLYDYAMLRFGPGSKLADRCYVRQDGTRSYYFKEEELGKLFEDAGFQVASNSYVTRQTINKKEGVDAQRVFIQAKFVKPLQ